MPKSEKTLTLWEIRYHNYAVNYDLRKQFQCMDIDEQERYHQMSFYLPPWTLNRYGCPQMDDILEMEMIRLANRSQLSCAWFLISYYTSESGWEQYVAQFNDLEPDPSYPQERFKVSLVLSDTVARLSTAPVDNS